MSSVQHLVNVSGGKDSTAVYLRALELGRPFRAVFADVAVWTHTVTTVEQMPALLVEAVNAAISEQGVAVLTIPGDVGGLELPKDTVTPIFARVMQPAAADAEDVRKAAAVLDDAARVTLLVGQGARHARAEVLALAQRLQAPMVLSLKAKEGFEDSNPFEIGQSGLIGNPATAEAFEACDVLLMVGTDFPYKEFYPQGKTVIQIDIRPRHIGRRTQVTHKLVGDSATTVAALLELVEQKKSDAHLRATRKKFDKWGQRQAHLTDPNYDRKPVGLLRRKVDNPQGRIRPELLAAAVERYAAQDAIFTTDTGMATVWLSRFVRMSGRRRLIGSYNLGSMANAVPHALGAQALDRERQVVALAGDGGLSMLLGDLITAVNYELPVKIMVFNNGRLGMVKLEMEQVGLPEFGTTLDNPDFAAVARVLGMHGIRVTDPHDVDQAISEALSTPGPVLVDVLTNPDEISMPPRPTLQQGWGFTIAKSKEFLDSPE